MRHSNGTVFQQRILFIHAIFIISSSSAIFAPAAAGLQHVQE
jgi:hypothetical protein